MPFLPNFGEMPDECIVRDEDGEPTGKLLRVVVKLRNGIVQGAEPLSATTPRGWDAATTRWSLTDHISDVMEFEVI